MQTIYLDNNATTQPLSAVVAAVTEASESLWANPSSLHRAGQAVRQRIELARDSVAGLIGAKPRELTFTSGGTESIDLALNGVLASARQQGRRCIVTSPIEHAAVREGAESLNVAGDCELRWAPVTPGGAINLDALSDLLDENVALVSIQWANNETGVIQPIEQIGELCRQRGVLIHTDAVQVVGKLPVDVTTFPVDLLSIASHKHHGPKGVGALWTRRGVRITPQQPGAHEGGRRGGTENVPGILGMGVAADSARDWLADESARNTIAALRDDFEQLILKRTPGAVVNASDTAPRLWNTTNIGFPKLEAEALLILLSERGLCASAGAACSSGSLEPSPVLIAMGVPENTAHGSLRFSLSRFSTRKEIEHAATIVNDCVERLRSSMASLS